MLASKKNMEDIKFILFNKEFLIETKFDGERIQCHFDEKQVRFFSRLINFKILIFNLKIMLLRNSKDVTHIYDKKITKLIRENVKAKSAILDGEIIVVDKTTGEAAPFGMNKTIAQENETEDSHFRLCCKNILC